MSSDQNPFTNYNSNQFTFHANFPPPTFLPPPPVPPPFFIPPIPYIQHNLPNVSQLTDQDYVKTFESKISNTSSSKFKLPSISDIRQELREMIMILNELKNNEKILSENINSLTESEWQKTMTQVENNKTKIDHILSQINDTYLDNLRKAIAKRTAKRLRMKKIHLERKKEKEEWIKECKERSRKIDENLQKIKDDIAKAKQEEEAKLEADSILKEVLRRKNDAKKCLVKLDALMKLRKARQNTAKGRGENVSEKDAVAFNENIEKLKCLWCEKLSAYEKEEAELREKLNQNKEKEHLTIDSDKELMVTLSEWKECLFGDSDLLPQYDFNGDIGRFISVRHQWDQFISDEGTPLPVGWVSPTPKL